MSYTKQIALIVATLQLGCSTPRTNTKVPQLDTAKEQTRQIYNDTVDAKSSVRRARTLSERIDAKLMLLK